MRFFGDRSNQENVYDHCGWCGREIRYGDTSVSISMNVERADERAGIEVMQSDVLLVLCESCGNTLGADSLRRTLDSQRPT